MYTFREKGEWTLSHTRRLAQKHSFFHNPRNSSFYPITLNAKKVASPILLDLLQASHSKQDHTLDKSVIDAGADSLLI